MKIVGVSNWIKGQIAKVHPSVSILIALVLLLLIDPIFRRVENMPDLVLRNEYQNQEAVNYFLARLGKAHPSVAFLGDSVLQGVTNTYPRDAAPILIQQKLRDAGIKATCFNMATMGYNMGDQFALASASIKSGADMLVLSVHYKLFSSSGTVGNTLRYKELAFFLRGESDFQKLRKDVFRISPRRWRRIRFDKNLENVWALYRYRGVLVSLLTGSTDNPLLQFQDFFSRALNIPMEGETGRNVLQILDPARRDREYIWKEMIDVHHAMDRKIYDQMDINPFNPHLKMLERVIEKARKKDVPLLVYFTPLNRELNEQHKYFTYGNLNHFKSLASKMILQGGARLVDLTDAVPSAHFTDMDHLTKKGHQILAEKLEPHVKAVLESEVGF